jgi:phosphonate degradation associated HDIG domain protein
MEKAYNASQVGRDLQVLFEKYGDEDYDGEPVSQTSHMVQAAMQAQSEGADVELVLGAFLHDIGHLLKHEQETEAMGDFGVVNHEGIGAKYLADRGFSARICAVVDKHVDAKRYLVTAKPGYKEKLSLASLKTLEYQGGPMNEAEAAAFEKQPYFEDIIRVRFWDEGAKDRELKTVPMKEYIKDVENYLMERNASR